MSFGLVRPIPNQMERARVLEFVEARIDKLIESRDEVLGGLLGAVVGAGVIVALLFVFGLLAYLVGLLVVAVVGLVLRLRWRSRAVGMGMHASAYGAAAAFPMLLFGAIFRSLG